MSYPEPLKPLSVITEEELKTMAESGYDQFAIKTTGVGDSAKNIVFYLNSAGNKIAIKEQNTNSQDAKTKECFIVELPKEYLPIPKWILIENATNPTYMR
ncbi:MAG: hypothetical protein WC916_03910 [Candidatus Woesearchaeota archaeon]